MTKLPLSECKLWWPSWQIGIPFKSFDGRRIQGQGYEFRVDEELDSWLCRDGQLMPISTAKLEDCDEGPIDWSSFTILPDNTVQVNYKVPGTDGYRIDLYPLEALSFNGYTYSDNE